MASSHKGRHWTGKLTRTHKATDRDHVGIANGTISPGDNIPKFFGKTGHAGDNPSSTKKQGGGKGNWGQTGTSELEDFNFNVAKPRRRTNSFSAAAGHRSMKTKFEAVDPEVIEFDEHTHGPTPADYAELEKMSTSSSADTMGSVDEYDEAPKEAHHK